MPDDMQLERSERELARWLTLKALHMACPGPLSDSSILSGLNRVPLMATLNTVRRDLDYLASKGLLDVVSKKQGLWISKLTHYGIDVVEGAKDCPPGIARPEEG